MSSKHSKNSKRYYSPFFPKEYLRMRAYVFSFRSQLNSFVVTMCSIR